jgi:hypothetical protein
VSAKCSECGRPIEGQDYKDGRTELLPVKVPMRAVRRELFHSDCINSAGLRTTCPGQILFELEPVDAEN